jgi:hypothetical protein
LHLPAIALEFLFTKLAKGSGNLKDRIEADAHQIGEEIHQASFCTLEATSPSTSQPGHVLLE